LGLTVVQDLREACAVAGPEELAEFEIDACSPGSFWPVPQPAGRRPAAHLELVRVGSCALLETEGNAVRRRPFRKRRARAQSLALLAA